MTICIRLLFGRGVFESNLSFFLKIPMTICILLLFGRGVCNWDLFLFYKFIWGSVPAYSVEEEFPIGIYSLPIKSYDNLRGLFNWDQLLSHKFQRRSARTPCWSANLRILSSPYLLISWMSQMHFVCHTAIWARRLLHPSAAWMIWGIETLPAGNEAITVRDQLTDILPITHIRLHEGAVNPLHCIDEMPHQCQIEGNRRQTGY